VSNKRQSESSDVVWGECSRQKLEIELADSQKKSPRHSAPLLRIPIKSQTTIITLEQILPLGLDQVLFHRVKLDQVMFHAVKRRLSWPMSALDGNIQNTWIAEYALVLNKCSSLSCATQNMS